MYNLNRDWYGWGLTAGLYNVTYFFLRMISLVPLVENRIRTRVGPTFVVIRVRQL